MAETLPYEPPTAARPVVVERDGGTTRVIVKMPGTYAPVPEWLGHLDLLALIAIPLWWSVACCARAILRLSNPPRAVFTIDGDRFAMELRDPRNGQITNVRVPREMVAAVRRNRFEPGLYLDVPGHVKETYLDDLDAATLERLEAAVSEAMHSEDRARSAGS